MRIYLALNFRKTFNLVPGRSFNTIYRIQINETKLALEIFNKKTLKKVLFNQNTSLKVFGLDFPSGVLTLLVTLYQTDDRFSSKKSIRVGEQNRNPSVPVCFLWCAVLVLQSLQHLLRILFNKSNMITLSKNCYRHCSTKLTINSEE